jgi:predicted dehydrogenase
LNPPEAKPLPDSKPLRFGFLGAAAIALMAFIAPVKSHPEAVVYAVAARSKESKRFLVVPIVIKVRTAQSWPVHFVDLDRILDDPEIDAIYNPVGHRS